ncbi:MAG: DegT/DnrJ/EryC1/StrS aminotransferase family protein [Desulfobulbaceae bacterium]|nr:DegT/DnrJ/EryC1/StrS aminotransferase family protein [Desulfobulbaceae bacterium]
MSAKFLSCNGLGYSPIHMISGLLHSYFRSPEWFQFADRDIIFTYQGRYAISLICQLLHIGADDEVIVPAYNCGAEIDPFVWAGAKAVFYRIDNKAMIDVEDIIRRVTPATRMIHVTHFFGWPQEIRELGEWCEKRGIFLVEDCAQALFSKGPNNTIGLVGDAAFYSFVKSLPVPDGGALVFKKNICNKSRQFRPPRLRNISRDSLPLLKKWFMQKNKFWQRYEFTRQLLAKSWFKNPKGQSCKIRPEMLKSNCLDEQKIDWSMSRISKGVLSTTNPNKIIEKRRRNYQYLHNSLFNIPSFNPLFNGLPDNVCPLSFPFFVKDRNRWYNALSDKGLLVLGWPGYYPRFDWDEFPEACNLKDNLLTLPVHQSLDIYHMEHIAKCVKYIAEEDYKSKPC